MFLSFNEYARPRLYPNPNRAALATVLPLAMVLAVSACASPQESLPAETDTASYGAYYQEATSPASTEVLGVIKDPETWALPFDPRNSSLQTKAPSPPFFFSSNTGLILSLRQAQGASLTL